MTLTTEQLGELTERINERLAEFDEAGAVIFERLSPGMVRLVFDVIAEWKQQREEQHDTAWRELARELVQRQEEREQPGFDVSGAGTFFASGGNVPAPPDAKLPETSKATNGNSVHDGFDPVADLIAHWPDMTDLTDGVDRFADPQGVADQHPIAGEVDEMDDIDDDDIDEAPKRKMTSVPPPQTAGVGSARRQQLDKLKHQRKRKMDYELPASAGHKGKEMPTLEDVVAEVRRLSMGTGIMPTLATFDAARPGNWATAGAHLKRFDMTWEQLAKEAELRPRQRTEGRS